MCFCKWILDVRPISWKEFSIEKCVLSCCKSWIFKMFQLMPGKVTRVPSDCPKLFALNFKEQISNITVKELLSQLMRWNFLHVSRCSFLRAYCSRYFDCWLLSFARCLLPAPGYLFLGSFCFFLDIFFALFITYFSLNISFCSLLLTLQFLMLLVLCRKHLIIKRKK